MLDKIIEKWVGVVDMWNAYMVLHLKRSSHPSPVRFAMLANQFGQYLNALKDK